MLPDSPVTKVASSGLIVVRRDDQRVRLLVLRRYSSWDFPAVQLEGDADPLEAAISETADATGITDLTFPWGEEYRQTLPFEDGYVSRYYLAQTETQDVVLRIPAGAGSEEDYEYRWVTAEEAEDILPPRLAIVLEWALAQIASAVPTRGG